MSLHFDFEMMTPREREERRAFLERRQNGIGGSDIPVILGLAPKINGKQKNARDVFYEKTRPITEEAIGSTSIHLWRGNVQEEPAFEAYLRRTGRSGELLKEPVAHPDYPNVVVSPDGITYADESREAPYQGIGVVEVKNPMSLVFGKVIDEGLRYSEIVQLNAEIAASQREWGTITYYNTEHSRGPVIYIDQPANPVLGKFCLEIGQRFWDEHVVPRIAPDPAEWAKLIDNPDAPEIVDLAGEVVVVRDDEFKALLKRTLDAKDLAKEAEDIYRGLQAEVFEATKQTGHAKVQVPGVGKVTVVTRKGHSGFNVDALTAHRPIDRDKLVRMLGDQISDEAWAALELDLDTFRTEGDPSQFILNNRSRDVE